MIFLLAALLAQDVAGIELGWRVKEAKGVVDILRKRLDTAGLQRCALSLDVDGLLLARIPGGTPEDAVKVKRLLSPRGLLEFRVTADREMQEQFVKDGVVPEGWEAAANAEPGRLGYEPWGEKVLLRKQSALGGGRLVKVEATRHPSVGSTQEWGIDFVLDATATRAFDATAAELYARRPPGLLAIVLDGRIHSLPVVMTDSFGSRGRIIGVGGEAEAKEQAIQLGAGALPAPLGEPEFERALK